MFEPPKRIDYGVSLSFSIDHLLFNYERAKETLDGSRGDPNLCGFKLPSWQRDFVWTEKQQLEFIDSVWRGVPIGTYSFNRPRDYMPKHLDNLLIDGQQRITTLATISQIGLSIGVISSLKFQNCMSGNCLLFLSIHTGTETTNEEYLKEYYNLMNFSGTRHEAHERA